MIICRCEEGWVASVRPPDPQLSLIRAFATDIAEKFTVNKNTQLIDRTGACEPGRNRMSENTVGLARSESAANSAVIAKNDK